MAAGGGAVEVGDLVVGVLVVGAHLVEAVGAALVALISPVNL